MTASRMPAPGVIVVAERSIHDLLADQEVAWAVQERQPSVSAMWDALSGGRLDQHSRILVFSDSLQEETEGDLPELEQTARAVVAMANAGARVFVAVWRPELLPRFEGLITAAAEAQGLGDRAMSYNILPADETGRAVLDALREDLGEEVSFPEEWAGEVDIPLHRDSAARPSIWAAGPLPSQPPGSPAPPTPELDLLGAIPAEERLAREAAAGEPPAAEAPDAGEPPAAEATDAA